MSFKLVAMDMDGTLLTDEKTITPNCSRALHAAAEKGCYVVVSTGRPIQGLEKYRDILDFNMPAITYNGAMIVMTGTKEILFHQAMSEAAVKECYEKAVAYEVPFVLWSDNQLYCNEKAEAVLSYEKHIGVTAQMITDIEDLASKGVTKFVWFDDPDKITMIEDELKSTFKSDATFCTSNPSFLEFFDSKVSKATAMQMLGKLLHIDRSEMIAVGDGMNDLPMLRYAGIGIAMDNASDVVKEACDTVTLSNQEDGVAAVIDKYIL